MSNEKSEYPKEVPAPLGLSEWLCSDNKMFYNSEMAKAHEHGIQIKNKRKNNLTKQEGQDE